MRAVNDGDPYPLPTGAIVAAYLLAVVCLLVPFGLVGVAFAAWVLVTRGYQRDAVLVVTIAVVCAVLGWTVLR